MMAELKEEPAPAKKDLSHGKPNVLFCLVLGKEKLKICGTS